MAFMVLQKSIAILQRIIYILVLFIAVIGLEALARLDGIMNRMLVVFICLIPPMLEPTAVKFFIAINILLGKAP